MQDEVEDTIQAIQKAQIKTWMLTGDKLETAMSIGYSSGLLHDNMSQFIVDGTTSAMIES